MGFEMTKSLILASISGVAIWVASPVLSYAEATCVISEAKRHVVNNVLCGQSAPEPEYHFSGPNCLTNSVTKRFEDTAIQIVVYRICGDQQFSDRLKEANFQTNKLFKLLSACTSERPDFNKILEDAITKAAQHAGSMTCPPEMRAMADSRRAYFEQTITLANDPKTVPATLEKLGITVDSSGNIRDK